jgi:predicted flap endonuclease-1-like 5' DNA nuclease
LSSEKRVQVMFCASLLTLSVICAAGPPALASHYRLSRVGFVTAVERQSLHGQSIHTTKRLLNRTLTRRARKQLALHTRISESRVLRLATLCDLLRIRGLGPTMARLLQAAKIIHTGTLARLSASQAWSRIKTSNAIHRITQAPPPREIVSDWIRQARQLERILKGLR